jgi:hypothetical protein
MAGPAPGSTVAYWRDDVMAYGVVAGEEKQRLLVVNREGKDERIAPARVTAILGGGVAPAKTAERRERASRAWLPKSTSPRCGSWCAIAPRRFPNRRSRISRWDGSMGPRAWRACSP